jgi:hypothetical protein
VAETPGVLERAQELRHPPRIDARTRRHLLPHPVRLALLIAAVGGDIPAPQHLGSAQELSRRTEDGGQDRACDGEQAHARRPRLPLRGMARRDVGDLVTDHVGDLVLGVGDREHPSRDVDVAAGKREGVGLLHVEDFEAVTDVLAR